MLIQELTELNVRGEEGQAAAQLAGDGGNQIAGQLADPPSADMIVIEPAHHLIFDQPPEVQGIMFDPDGVTAYVHLWAQYIDVWDVLLSVLPWVMAVVGGLVILAMLRVGYRRIKNQEVVGRSYCRKCGYELDGERPRSICPECGLDSSDHPARTGRRLRRRLAMPIATVAFTIPISIIVGMARSWVPSDLLVWPSVRLAEMATEKGWARLDPFLRDGDWVRRFNLETGQFGSAVCVRPGRSYYRMTISPDGTSFYRGRPGSEIERIDIASGRMVGRLALSQSARMHLRAPAVIGHERDGKDALVFFLDHDRKMHALVRWNLETNAHEVVLEERAWSSDDGYTAERILMPVSLQTGGVYLSMPTFMESYGRRLHEFRLLDASGNVVRTIERTDYSYSTPPVVSLDGQWMYSLTSYGRSIKADNPSTGEPRGTLGLDHDLGSLGTLTLAPDDRHLLLSYRDVFVRDVRARRWVAKLRGPEGLYAADPFLSADARWFAVVSQRNSSAAESARGLRSAHDLVIWDVSQLGLGGVGSER